MDDPTEEFLQSMMGKTVAITTTTDRIVHGVLLVVAPGGIVIGTGKLKDPKPIHRSIVSKCYPMQDVDYEKRPGMVRSTR